MLELGVGRGRRDDPEPHLRTAGHERDRPRQHRRGRDDAAVDRDDVDVRQVLGRVDERVVGPQRLVRPLPHRGIDEADHLRQFVGPGGSRPVDRHGIPIDCSRRQVLHGGVRHAVVAAAVEPSRIGRPERGNSIPAARTSSIAS